MSETGPGNRVRTLVPPWSLDGLSEHGAEGLAEFLMAPGPREPTEVFPAGPVRTLGPGSAQEGCCCCPFVLLAKHSVPGDATKYLEESGQLYLSSQKSPCS